MEPWLKIIPGKYLSFLSTNRANLSKSQSPPGDPVGDGVRSPYLEAPLYNLEAPVHNLRAKESILYFSAWLHSVFFHILLVSQCSSFHFILLCAYFYIIWNQDKPMLFIKIEVKYFCLHYYTKMSENYLFFYVKLFWNSIKSAQNSRGRYIFWICTSNSFWGPKKASDPQLTDKYICKTKPKEQMRPLIFSC